MLRNNVIERVQTLSCQRSPVRLDSWTLYNAHCDLLLNQLTVALMLSPAGRIEEGRRHIAHWSCRGSHCNEDRWPEQSMFSSFSVRSYSQQEPVKVMMKSYVQSWLGFTMCSGLQHSCHCHQAASHSGTSGNLYSVSCWQQSSRIVML